MLLFWYLLRRYFPLIFFLHANVLVVDGRLRVLQDVHSRNFASMRIIARTTNHLCALSCLSDELCVAYAFCKNRSCHLSRSADISTKEKPRKGLNAMCSSDAIKATVIYPLVEQTHDNTDTLDLSITQALSTKVPVDSICFIVQMSVSVECQCAAAKPSTQWFAIVREHKGWFWAREFCKSLEGVLFYTENWPPAELDFFYTVIQEDEFWVGLRDKNWTLKTAWGTRVDSELVLVNADDNGPTTGCVKAKMGRNPSFYYDRCYKHLSFICASTEFLTSSY